MPGYIEKILSIVALVNLSFAPSAKGFTSYSGGAISQATQYRKVLEPLGYRVSVNNEAQKIEIFDKATNRLSFDAPFGNTADLRRFTPTNLNKMMREEMSRIKTTARSTFSNTVRNLPTESAMFFIAMGAVVAGQLIGNYSQNPIAMQQHIDHQLSPMGTFGFFVFMYSQGLTSNVLSMYVKNPAMHHFIPYLGMSVGAFMQTYLSSMLADPNVIACGKQMLGLQKKSIATLNENDDPCTKAYEYLVLQKKIWEFAPGLASMLLSSGVAALGQAAIAKSVLRLTGVDIALWLTPGTMQIKGVKLILGKGLQLTAFTALDLWLNRHVTFAWKNFFDGAEFVDINVRLNKEVAQAKNGTQHLQNKDAVKEINLFQQKMTAWRMVNLADVYEAHQNWSEALLQMTSMFNSSYSFYNAFINEVRNARFNQSQNQLLRMDMPFNGVTPLGLETGHEDLYLTHPRMIENMQMDTISEAVFKGDGILLSANAKLLYPQEYQTISTVLDNLRNGDKRTVGRGLVELNRALDEAQRNVYVASPNYLKILKDLRSLLGNPEPLLGGGRAFGASFEKSPTLSDSLKKTSFYREVGIFHTPNISDYLIMQMICGPELETGASAIKTPKVAGQNAGFPSVFLPPRIANFEDNFEVCENSLKATAPVDRIYNWSIDSKSGGTYQGFVQYLVAETRNSVVGDSALSAFPTWWKKHTEAQIRNVFSEYSKSYDEIIAKLVGRLFSTERSSFNRGPIANGVIEAAFQEERTYLSILNSLIDRNYRFHVQFDQPANKIPITHPVLIEVDRQFVELVKLLREIKTKKIANRDVVTSSIENYQLEEQLTAIQEQLTVAADHLGVGEKSANKGQILNEAQRDIAVTVLSHLRSLASEMAMYGSIANAVSWEKIQNLKQMDIENQKIINTTQEKMNQIRMQMPEQTDGE
ncbi:hypothetical protein [Bdellovibrio bacteriovorus]|uniref:Uncharacterized protein n=1 Tax=Bdellovibrio bacteriovorus str. Tiberius TaxID=1069642 RepID=K7YT24_BDEBC|nr:hypothetical protein [Bdellovibrio bacteriovorus]AFY00778.1 hypothetical protein Bdt_1078 [Bdellovibrio bacteriovorus str. Tiberius]